MNLHEDTEPFRELISLTAQHLTIPEVYVEKDYWVTHVLLLLSLSEYRDDFIFKGGTALSKAFGIIKRFSEDVDLALLNNNLSGNQVKSRLSAAEKAITAGLTYVKRPDESKGSSFRKVYFESPRIVKGEFGHASDVVLLETNSFTSPEPFKLMPVQSIIAEYLRFQHFPETIEQYGLESFEVNVLQIQRTVAEKIVGLVRAARAVEPKDALTGKIRHIYDLCMIKRNEQHSRLFSSNELHGLIDIVIAADRKQFRDAESWLGEPLHECTLFSQAEATWATLRGTFHRDFAELVYDNDLPSDEEVNEMLASVALVLRERPAQLA